ncbi:MAG: diguanylate cyclase domain-containing protein [Limnochordia bacterium]|jgi:diguanylate cyclase (GGDEF)-like protein/PAS domain S-box-containing protein
MLPVRISMGAGQKPMAKEVILGLLLWFSLRVGFTVMTEAVRFWQWQSWDPLLLIVLLSNGLIRFWLGQHWVGEQIPTQISAQFHQPVLFFDPQLRMRWRNQRARTQGIIDCATMRGCRECKPLREDCLFHRALAIGRPQEELFGGEGGWWLIEAVPVFSSKGVLLGIYATRGEPMAKLDRALISREKRYRLMFWNAPDGMYRSTPEGKFLEVNPALVRLLGYPSREALMKVDITTELYFSWVERPHPEDTYQKYVTRLKRGDGQEIWVEINSRRTYDEEYGQLVYEGIVRDISIRMETEQELRRSRDDYLRMLEDFPAMLWRTDRLGNCDYVNKNWVIFTGRSPEVNFGQGWWDNIHPDDVEGCRSKLTAAWELRQSVEMEYRLRHFDGKYRWIVHYAYPFYNGEGRFAGYMGACYDISERKAMEARIKNLSFRDSLTGLYNRAFFEEELARLNCARQLPLSIILGDVNGLKLVNDTFGHQVGDQVLIDVARSLKQVCRREDIIARWGGDEFAILLPKTDGRKAQEIVERISAYIREGQSEQWKVDLSLGAATRTTMEEDVYQILREAEQKMYQHKMLESRSSRNSLIATILHVVNEKDPETENHSMRLQPIILRFGEILGLTADELDALSLLCVLHDIGKVGVDDGILNKSGKLSRQEWEEMKRHPEIGYRICLASPELTHIAEDILYHHEWWDGRGYPRGLKGQEIPLRARILAIVDAYDVMTNDRPYQRARSHDLALKELARCAGSQFDPYLVQVFLASMATDSYLQEVAAANG